MEDPDHSGDQVFPREASPDDRVLLDTTHEVVTVSPGTEAKEHLVNKETLNYPAIPLTNAVILVHLFLKGPSRKIFHVLLICPWSKFIFI